MQRWKDYYLKIVKGSALVGSVFVFLVVVYITADVAGRYLANRPMPASFEIQKTFIVFIVFLALAYTQSRGGHLRLEFISRRFNPRGQAILDILSLLIGLVLFAIITWQAWDWAWEAWQLKEYMEGIFKIPYFPARFALALGAFLFSVQFAIDLIQRISQLRSMGEVGQ